MRLDLSLGLDSAISLRQPAWSPARLFATGASGAFFSAHQGLFQNVAGTLPVTTPGQSVALMRDLSGQGNHATQPVVSQRPTFGRHPASGIRNLLANNMPSGAVLGVLGAGGALPSNWGSSFSGGASGTVEVVGIGPTHLDLRIVQTGSSGAIIIRPTASNLPTQPGEVWTFSASLALIAGDLGGNGTPQLRGTQRNPSGGVLASIEFLGTLPISPILTRYNGTATISDSNAALMNPDFRVNATGPWTATFRISLPQCERGAVSTPIQTVQAGGFDVTETGQRSIFYLQPDGVDDWMQFTTPFVATERYTLAAASNAGIDPIYGNIASSDSNAVRHRLLTTVGGRMRLDITTGRSLVADTTIFAQRNVHIIRATSPTAAEIWANGNPITGARTGNLAPLTSGALFRFGSTYGTGRFYGGALMTDALSPQSRDRLQDYLMTLAGVSP